MMKIFGWGRGAPGNHGDHEFGEDNVHPLEFSEDLIDPERAATECVSIMLQRSTPEDMGRTADHPEGHSGQEITRLLRNAFYFCLSRDNPVAPVVEQDPELADRIERALYRRLVALVRESRVLDAWLRQEDPDAADALKPAEERVVEGWLRDHLALYVQVLLSTSDDQWRRDGMGYPARVVLCVHRWSVRPYFEQARRANAALEGNPVYEVGLVRLRPPASGRLRLNLHTREGYDPLVLPILSNMGGCALTLGEHPANDMVVELPDGRSAPRAGIVFRDLRTEGDGPDGVRVRGQIEVRPRSDGLNVRRSDNVQQLLTTEPWDGTQEPRGEIALCILQSTAFKKYDTLYFRPYVRPFSRALPRAGGYPCYGRVPALRDWEVLATDGFDTLVQVREQVVLAARPRTSAQSGPGMAEGDDEDYDVMVVVPAASARELVVTNRTERVEPMRLPQSGLTAYPLRTGTLLEMEGALRGRWIGAAATGTIPPQRFHGELWFGDDRAGQGIDFQAPQRVSFAARGAPVLSATTVDDTYLSREPSNLDVVFGPEYGSAALVLPYSAEQWSRERASPAYPAVFVRVGGASEPWRPWHPDPEARRLLEADGAGALGFAQTVEHLQEQLPGEILDRQFEVIVGSTRYLVAPRNTP